jgi:hypothetical protein
VTFSCNFTASTRITTAEINSRLSIRGVREGTTWVIVGARGVKVRTVGISEGTTWVIVGARGVKVRTVGISEGTT